MMRVFYLTLALQVALCYTQFIYGPDVEPTWNIRNPNTLKTKELWFQDAQRTIYDKLVTPPNQYKAKNIIFFLGDGMSLATVAASRIYDGQVRGIVGERNRLEFEKFNHVGLSKTYCADRQVSDSACTATAYLTGIKGNYLTIGVSGDVSVNNCVAEKVPANRLPSIAAWAQKAGMSTGFVTTTRITHASVAGVYAHTSNRDFESDNDIKTLGQSETECTDIARQLIEGEVGKRLKVVLGGGATKLIPNTETVLGKTGERNDGRNLIREWQAIGLGNSRVAYNRSDLLATNLLKTDRLLGLFSSSHLPYNLERNTNTPLLSEMTEAAIAILSKDPNGFFLFVEGGRIDHAHHATKAKRALDETVQFSKAIAKARQLTNPYETLTVVTADHGHTMTISGYPDINNDITGLNSEKSDVDNLPYTTLSYANGPEPNTFLEIADGTITRTTLSATQFAADNPSYPHLVPMKEETHDGSDVPVYANGPWAHLFTGVYEQNVLPFFMGYAACIGPGLTNCNAKPLFRP